MKAKAAPKPAESRPFRIKALMFQAEVEFYDPTTLKTTDRDLSERVVIFESDFPADLIALLQTKGIFPPTESLTV